MAKFLNDAVLDPALDEIKDNVNLMVLCSQQPATRADAVSTYALADVAMVSGDFTKADGDTSGRKLTVAEKTAVDVDADGTGTHVALVDSTRLLAVTTCSSVIVDDSETITIPTWDIELPDP